MQWSAKCNFVFTVIATVTSMDEDKKNSGWLLEVFVNKSESHLLYISCLMATNVSYLRREFMNNISGSVCLLSIRAHTKMGGPVVMEMFPDTTNRPLAPVSYIGPEKSKVVVPLTQEQLETHVYMMFSVLEKCHVIQRDLCNGLKNDEIASFQTMFEDMSAFFNKTFVDLRKQEQLIQDMNSTLRSRCISMFRSIHSTNEHIPWLKRKITPEWMSVYDQSLERSVTMNDADVWNRVSKHKATIESTIGKEAIRSELNEEQSNKKQKK